MERRPLFDHVAVYALALSFAFCRLAHGQILNGPTNPAPATQSRSSSDTSSTYNTNDSGQSGGGVSGQNPFYGSVPEGKATAEVLPLSLRDAMDRGLKNNLGLLLRGDNTLTARGEKWKELSALLPNVNAGINESATQIDLAAEGFRFNTPGIPRIIGPVGIFQANVFLTQSVFDLHAIDRKRGASANENAALATTGYTNGTRTSTEAAILDRSV